MRTARQFRARVALSGILVASFISSVALADDGDRTVQQAQAVSQTATNPNLDEWSLINLTPADVASASGGSGVKVAVLDGVADCRHSDLAGRCSNVLLPRGRYRFYGNHGTHTAGIVAGNQFGVATSATVINYAVFDDRGWIASGSMLSDVWNSAYNAGARISSMSFGCSRTALCFSSAELTTMATTAMPMLYVKAAGNDGVALGNESSAISSATASAALNRIILVGSVNAAGSISTFSNQPGEGCLLSSGITTCSESMKWKYHFIVAPGEAIYSTLPGNGYGYMSGTSMATPVVAGVAALLQQRWPMLKNSPETLARILFTTATDKGAPGVDTVYGYGLLNAAAAFQANGTVAIISPAGTMTTVSGTATTSTKMLSQFSQVLGQTTVYDQFGRDFTLAETGAMQTRPRQLATRQLLGRRLLGASGMDDWAASFFADEAQLRGFAIFGSPAGMPGDALPFDQSARMGVDLPFKGGLAQFRLTGSGDPRLDFAYDPTMRPLAYFASTGLLQGALVSNALIRLPGNGRLMVYGIVTPGAMSARVPYNLAEMRLTNHGYLPRAVLAHEGPERRQSGVGAGYWLHPDAKTIVGVNVSALTQRGGYYTLTSDLAGFEQPTQLFNLGVAASRRFGDWEMSLSGEMTHLNMHGGQGAISITPANLVSAEFGLRKSRLAFGQGDLRDSLGLAFVLPPRAVSGELRVDYMTRTADGLGMQPAATRVGLSQLGQEPARIEAAYRLRSGQSWSLSLSGGYNLAKSEETGAGEVMANFRLSL